MIKHNLTHVAACALNVQAVCYTRLLYVIAATSD